MQRKCRDKISGWKLITRKGDDVTKKNNHIFEVSAECYICPPKEDKETGTFNTCTLSNLWYGSSS